MESAGKPSKENNVRGADYVELASDPKAPINVAVTNLVAPEKQPVIYIGDATRSVLTLTLTNQTNNDFKLRAAASVPPSPDKADSTATVYLDFRKLFDANVLAGLSVSGGSGWRTDFLSSVRPQLWAYALT
jgi:hypothetical protein